MSKNNREASTILAPRERSAVTQNELLETTMHCVEGEVEVVFKITFYYIFFKISKNLGYGSINRKSTNIAEKKKSK